MPHDTSDSGADRDLAARLAELPRTTALTPGEVDRLADQLRRDGFFRPPRIARPNRVLRYALAAAAALVLFAAGAAAGMRYAGRNSLEGQLARRDLTTAERMLLLQRAGSAYVQAAQSIADAHGRIDPQSAEVADQILAGAANAVARTTLDASLSRQLASVLMPAATRRVITWF